MLPNLGQGLGHVHKMVTQRMNLREFSNVIYVFGSYILITKPIKHTSLLLSVRFKNTLKCFFGYVVKTQQSISSSIRSDKCFGMFLSL